MVTNPSIRKLLTPFLLLAAIAACIYYLLGHRSLIQQLLHTPAKITSLVMILYIAMFGVLLLILAACLRICAKKIENQENSVVNAHTLLINFFMPAQGGPAYRGAYLYKRHRLSIKKYVGVTLLYYAFYASISIFLLLIGSGRLWQSLLAVVLSLAASVLVITRYSRRTKLNQKSLNLSGTNLLLLFGATLLQAVIQVCIYAVELHSVNHKIGFGQIITYTGAANLALFVALTPGAIGIRESFLLLTQRLHHISGANIVVANVIDRSVYLAFLLGLLAIVIIHHAKGRLRIKQIPLLVKQSLKLDPSES